MEKRSYGWCTAPGALEDKGGRPAQTMSETAAAALNNCRDKRDRTHSRLLGGNTEATGASERSEGVRWCSVLPQSAG